MPSLTPPLPRSRRSRLLSSRRRAARPLGGPSPLRQGPGGRGTPGPEVPRPAPPFGSLAIRRFDLVAVKEMMGHSKLTTTERYLHSRPGPPTRRRSRDLFRRRGTAGSLGVVLEEGGQVLVEQRSRRYQRLPILRAGITPRRMYSRAVVRRTRRISATSSGVSSSSQAKRSCFSVGAPFGEFSWRSAPVPPPTMYSSPRAARNPDYPRIRIGAARRGCCRPARHCAEGAAR